MLSAEKSIVISVFTVANIVLLQGMRTLIISLPLTMFYKRACVTLKINWTGVIGIIFQMKCIYGCLIHFVFKWLTSQLLILQLVVVFFFVRNECVASGFSFYSCSSVVPGMDLRFQFLFLPSFSRSWSVHHQDQHTCMSILIRTPALCITMS